MQIATGKRNRGVEEVETVTVEVSIAQLKQELGTAFENGTIESYFKSSMFRKEFKLDGDKIKCTRTM